MSEPCATAPLTVFKEWPTAFQQPLKRPQDLHPAGLGGWRCGAKWLHKNSGDIMMFSRCRGGSLFTNKNLG